MASTTRRWWRKRNNYAEVLLQVKGTDRLPDGVATPRIGGEIKQKASFTNPSSGEMEEVRDAAKRQRGKTTCGQLQHHGIEWLGEICEP